MNWKSISLVARFSRLQHWRKFLFWILLSCTSCRYRHFIRSWQKNLFIVYTLFWMLRKILYKLRYWLVRFLLSRLPASNLSSSRRIWDVFLFSEIQCKIKSFNFKRNNGKILLMVENPFFCSQRLDRRSIICDMMKPSMPFRGHLGGIIIEPHLNSL